MPSNKTSLYSPSTRVSSVLDIAPAVYFYRQRVVDNPNLLTILGAWARPRHLRLIPIYKTMISGLTNLISFSLGSSKVPSEVIVTGYETS